MEELHEQIDKMSEVFDYIAEKTDDKEAGIICDKLGLDNPHFARRYTKEHFIQLADKLIRFREILRSNT